MSAKLSNEMPLSRMSKMIRRSRRKLRESSIEHDIDVMVRAGLFTPEQAARAKQRLVELREQAAAEAQPAGTGPAATAEGA